MKNYLIRQISNVKEDKHHLTLSISSFKHIYHQTTYGYISKLHLAKTANVIYLGSFQTLPTQT